MEEYELLDNILIYKNIQHEGSAKPCVAANMIRDEIEVIKSIEQRVEKEEIVKSCIATAHSGASCSVLMTSCISYKAHSWPSGKRYSGFSS
jgi:hypothetical protein